jgi:hypothetical protein
MRSSGASADVHSILQRGSIAFGSPDGADEKTSSESGRTDERTLVVGELVARGRGLFDEYREFTRRCRAFLAEARPIAFDS